MIRYFILLILFLCTTLAAETPAPTAAPTPQPSKSSDILDLEYDLIEATYRGNPSETNRAMIVEVMERYINARCMPGLQKDLGWNGMGSGDTRCRRMVDFALEIDPTNPPALCARDGIDSPSCAAAYEGQALQVISTTSGKSAPSDLDAILEAKKEKDDPEIESAYSSALSDFRGDKLQSEEKKNAVYRSLQAGLSKFCRVSRTKVLAVPSPTPSVAASKSPATTPTSIVKPIDAMLAEIADRKKTGSPSSLAKRHRLVSPLCSKWITRANEFDPKHWLAGCYKDGFYSPRCIQARRRDLLEKRKSTGKSTSVDFNSVIEKF